MRASDLILHAGDFTSTEVLDDISALGKPVVAVRGNMDAPGIRRALPDEQRIEVDGVRIAMLHDAGPYTRRLDRMRAAFPGSDVVIYGHSHVPLHEERDGFQIFNPGSPTDRRRQPRHSMGMATIEAGRASFEVIWLD
jgi:putative phosphoesterase